MFVIICLMYLYKSLQGLFRQHVPGATTHVALLDKWLESPPKVERLGRVELAEEKPEVLDDHVSVVIRLHEPVRLLQVVPVDVLEGVLGLGPEVVPPLAHVEPDGGQLGVRGGAHEQQRVAPPPPRGPHVPRLHSTRASQTLTFSFIIQCAFCAYL